MNASLDHRGSEASNRTAGMRRGTAEERERTTEGAEVRRGTAEQQNSRTAEQQNSRTLSFVRSFFFFLSFTFVAERNELRQFATTRPDVAEA
jgi:site-specific recombinase XerD